MSVNLDNPSPECAQWARFLEAATKECNALRAENKRLRANSGLTAKRLAALLAEELGRDGWGDIDPYWLTLVADGLTEVVDQPHQHNAEELSKVLDRVVARLKEELS